MGDKTLMEQTGLLVCRCVFGNSVDAVCDLAEMLLCQGIIGGNTLREETELLNIGAIVFLIALSSSDSLGRV